MNNINKKNIAYSIRQCSEDEIEIRNAIFDGYVRGFIRFILLAVFLMVGIGANSIAYPFKNQIRSIQNDFVEAYNPDKFILPSYERYMRTVISENYMHKYPNYEIMTYEEYRKPYLKDVEKYKKWVYFHFIWPFFLFLAIFSPRPRGIRINRKKRVIYWQTILGSHTIAFVPEQGDPLAGLNYNLFGLYAFGGNKRFSLQFWIDDDLTKRRGTACFGVYPSPSEHNNPEIIRAMRAYLTEDNPEFLRDIGRDFKNFGCHPLITFCNAFALRVPFNRQKAERAIDAALARWNKKTAGQKQAWFNAIRHKQKCLNENIQSQGFNNRVD